MDLRQLRYFATVARERSFTRAAEQLHIAQPPLSRQVQLLEEELGVRLLSRDSRPVQLTEAGRQFYEQALQLLGRVEQLKLATQQIGRGERRLLSIGLVPSVLYGELPWLLRRLRKQVPDMDFQFIEMMSLQQLEALRNGRIDLGFGRIPANFPDITRVVLREERLVVACPHDSPYAAHPTGTPLPFAALAGHRLIVYPKEPRPSFADQVLSLVRRHQVQLLDIQEVNEMQTGLGMVAAEAGLCIVPASAELLRSDVHYRLLDDEHATSPVIMSYRANDNSSIPELILRLLKELYAEKHAWAKYSYNRLGEPDSGEPDGL
ncbi:LysR family transcriptional regulator [Bordetella sp. H567]|uniref:LysR family transcriptional regulator n=1 Tax=Bordetella sp. H567 TaxID=1697043 RepID=UPI00081CDE6E|nr:LysR family transcriptional regulator [Bordetella sp. H567]AOB31363.1 LysR family transcriptional regulator [Bordetella sp. H567]